MIGGSIGDDLALNFRVEDQFADHIPALQRFARTLTSAPDLADDLVQDCLERAIRKKSLFRSPANPRAWLFKIMHNLHRNQVVQKRPHIGSVELVDAAEPPRQLAASELNDVKAAMEMLSQEHKQILMLVAVEGLSYKEAAQILGIQKGTVMSRLARARDQLRSIMNGDQQTRGETR